MRHVAAALFVLAGLLAALIYALNVRDEPDLSGATARATPELIARGEYLARAGNCIGCHTARGGVPFAGGRAIATPFGTVHASNLTPDEATGIGGWSSAQFWRALHNGRSADGRLLYPAFPYPSYTVVRRADSDAIHAYLRSLPATVQSNRPHELRFPYNSQFALALWRALYFRPASFEDDPRRGGQWNRGAYLVQGLGHCNACHASRNLLGATGDGQSLSGGLIPMRNWYAPSLTAPHEASVAAWEPAEIVQLLKTGINLRAVVIGPMKDVVLGSTQHLSDADLHAVAVFLKALPPSDAERQAPAPLLDKAQLERGGKLYEKHCVQCHGEAGQGASGAYPPLAANRALTLDPPANLVRIIRGGGFPPATRGNPRPYGMPPFATVLDDAAIADVSTFIRNAWGNRASAVSALDVRRYSGGVSE